MLGLLITAPLFWFGLGLVWGGIGALTWLRFLYYERPTPARQPDHTEDPCSTS